MWMRSTQVELCSQNVGPLFSFALFVPIHSILKRKKRGFERHSRVSSDEFRSTETLSNFKLNLPEVSYFLSEFPSIRAVTRELGGCAKNPSRH